MSGHTFRSDNNAGLCPEAVDAMLHANDGSHVTGYGSDSFTDEAISAFRRVFGQECSVWFVATGTAANTLAIASLTSPWERILCHQHSHLNADESTAPERLIGCRMTAVDSDDSKLTPADIEKHGQQARGDVHEPQPGVLTISNPTEFGTVYTPDEVRSLCEAAHAFGYRVHVDGARFANAVAHLGCDPRDLSVNAGIDALSFGGTKNGLASGEAVLFFPQRDGLWFERAVHAFPYLRKASGHLLSKHRFVAAPFARTLESGAWLRHAEHANTLASELSRQIAAAGFAVRYATESNGVFVSLTDAVHARLVARGHQYYLFGPKQWCMARLMCSFDTQREEIDALVSDIQRCQRSSETPAIR